MADDVSMISSRYRLVSVTFNERPYDIAVSTQGVRIPVVFVEAPSATLSRLRATAITMRERAIDLSMSSSATRLSVIMMPPPANVTSVRQVVIITQNEQGTPTYSQQTFQQVAGSATYLPAPMVFSMEGNRMLAQHALVQSDKMEWPKSNIHNGQSAMLAVHDTLAVMPSSLTRVAQLAQLELRSLVEERVPVSMNYQYQMVEKILVARDPEPMYGGSSRVHSVAEKVLRAIPAVGPVHSNTTSASSASMALLSKPVPLYISDTHSRETAEMALIATEPELPISPSESASTVSMALQGYYEEEPVSATDGAATSESVLVDAKNWYAVSPVGMENVATAVQRVLMAADYPPPNGMSGVNEFQLSEMTLVQNLEPFPTVPAQIFQQGLEWLIGTKYQTPEEMLPPAKLAISSSLSHRTLMALDIGIPISTTRVPSIGLLTTISDDQPSPESMLNTGTFISVVGYQVAEPAEYDSAKAAFSQLTSGMLAEIAACADDTFPSKGYSTSTMTAGMVSSVVAMGDTSFPSKDTVYSTLSSSAVYEVVAINDESFPPKNAVVSFLNSSLVTAVAAFQDNDWPNKNMVQSSLRADLITQVSAVSAAYPDKNTPSSYVQASIAGQVVAVKDTSMYAMPERAIRRRPNISVTIVY